MITALGKNHQKRPTIVPFYLPGLELKIPLPQLNPALAFFSIDMFFFRSLGFY